MPPRDFVAEQAKQIYGEMAWQLTYALARAAALEEQLNALKAQPSQQADNVVQHPSSPPAAG